MSCQPQKNHPMRARSVPLMDRVPSLVLVFMQAGQSCERPGSRQAVLLIISGICFFLPFRWWYVLSDETSRLALVGRPLSRKVSWSSSPMSLAYASSPPFSAPALFLDSPEVSEKFSAVRRSCGGLVRPGSS